MARFSEQPFVTAKMWSIMVRFIIWIVVASTAHNFSQGTESALIAGLLGLGMGLSLIVVAWGHDDEAAADGYSHPTRLKKWLGMLAAVLVVGLWIWNSLARSAAGIDKDTIFSAGYFVGLACVGVASSRGYLKSRSIT
jgi:hypothetical protein